MEIQTQQESIFYKNIERGKQKRLFSINEKIKKVIYKASRKFSANIKNPEELVRASYFTQLVLDYQYPAENIDFELPTKPDKDRIDILVYADKERKDPFIVVECKKDGISDAEFKNAIEQAFRYANYKKVHYAIVVAGTTKAAYLAKDFKGGEWETM